MTTITRPLKVTELRATAPTRYQIVTGLFDDGNVKVAGYDGHTTQEFFEVPVATAATLANNLAVLSGLRVVGVKDVTLLDDLHLALFLLSTGQYTPETFAEAIKRSERNWIDILRAQNGEPPLAR